MEVDFVSEVDRKFFANNMLSNEDWEASMELSDMMGLENSLPDTDLLTDLANDLQLPSGTDPLTFYTSPTHDDLLNDWSDSSDSGVSGVTGVQSPTCTIKSEPLSPALSHNSDSTDSGLSLITDPLSLSSGSASSMSASSSLVNDVIKIESPPPPSYTLHNGTSVTDLTQLAATTTLDLTASQCNSNPILSTINIPSSSGPVTPSVNIHSILNSKVKIQPKPDAGSSTEPASPHKSHPSGNQVPSSQKSIVLTPEEFQHLTSQGVLRFQPPPKQESLIKPQVITKIPLPTQQQQQPTPLPILTPNTVLPEDPDCKALKRQQRMIKNRESASLSRKRKKEYMSSLEYRLQEFSTENEKLRQENLALKRRLSVLHTENENLKGSFSLPSPAKKTCLMAIFVVLCLNLGAWSGITWNTQGDLKQKVHPSSLVHRGRQLMSVAGNGEELSPLRSMEHADTVDLLHNLILQYGDTTRPKLNLTDVPPMCPTYFNKTESMRLAEQLAGWMYRHEEEKKKVSDKQQQKRQREKQLRPISTLKKAMRGELKNAMDRKYSRSMEAKYQLKVFDGADSGRDFLKSIHRRNDTFYVLSFDEDYYLVPAVYHNKTRRPRMSLVMPALALNDSMMPPDGQIGMMQIDCEVMNTQLIHVRKSAIPRHMRERYNTTYSKYDEDRYYT